MTSQSMIGMKRSRRLHYAGILLLAAGLVSVLVFGLQTYTLVYDCEHLTGAVPVQGCEYYLQLSYYSDFLSNSFPLWLGVSLAVIGACLLLLRRFSGP
jgi:hypothetical protein